MLGFQVPEGVTSIDVEACGAGGDGGIGGASGDDGTDGSCMESFVTLSWAPAPTPTPAPIVVEPTYTG